MNKTLILRSCFSLSGVKPYYRKTSRKSAERGYYAKRVIMMILMIMVMNVHNLWPLSVKTILAETGRKWVVNVPFSEKCVHMRGMFDGYRTEALF